MKTLSIIATAATLLLATSTHASESTLTPYFDALVGHWDGQGQVRSTEQNFNYRMDLHVEREAADPAAWNAHTQANSDSGAIASQDLTFTVRGDILYVSGEAVRILESSPLSLTYQIVRADTYSGRIFVTTFEAQSDGNTLSGHNIVETAGVTIQDETFTAHHW